MGYAVEVGCCVQLHAIWIDHSWSLKSMLGIPVTSTKKSGAKVIEEFLEFAHPDWVPWRAIHRSDSYLRIFVMKFDWRSLNFDCFVEVENVMFDVILQYNCSRHGKEIISCRTSSSSSTACSALWVTLHRVYLHFVINLEPSSWWGFFFSFFRYSSFTLTPTIVWAEYTCFVYV